MGDWALHDGQRVLAGVLETGSSRPKQWSSGGSAHQMGAWQTLVDAGAVPYEASAIELMFRGTANSRNLLIDIAIGSGTPETFLVEKLFHSAAVRSGPWNLALPLRVPAGAQIVARVQASTGSTAIVMGVHLLGGGFAARPPLSRATTYGANVATSGGVSVDPGGTINTKGAWVEIEDSTPNQIKSLVVFAGTQLNTAMVTANWFVDVGVGAEDSEAVVLPDLYLAGAATVDLAPTALGPYSVTIPAGSRLAVRSQCSLNDATDRLLDFVLLGLD